MELAALTAVRIDGVAYCGLCEAVLLTDITDRLYCPNAPHTTKCGAAMLKPPRGWAHLRCGKFEHVGDIHTSVDAGGKALGSWHEGD